MHPAFKTGKLWFRAYKPKSLDHVCSKGQITGFVGITDPPVKAIISVRCQVLLQLAVGLLDLPTEVFQLAVQRVLQIVGVHYAERQPAENGDGEIIGRPWRAAPCSVPIVLSFNWKRNRSCFICVGSKRERGGEKQQKLRRGRKRRAQRMRVTWPGFSTTDRDADLHPQMINW